jgi:RHS repeat-associated protein
MRRNGPWGTATYAYDLAGNRTSEVTVSGATTTKSYAYPAANNRLASETVNGTLARSMAYDGAGNLLTGLPMGAAYSMLYDNRNRAQRMKLNGTTVATYFYNGLEQLAARTLVLPLTPAGATLFVYDLEGHLISESTGTTAAASTVTREYIWLGDMPVMVVDGVALATPTLSAVHVDHLMRPVRLTNAAKAAVWDATWLPWGGAHVTSGTAAMNLRFPGQYFLIEQGMAYNWHRNYDHTTARYTQPDPLGFPDGSARYAYAGNSPLMNVDPKGLFVFPSPTVPTPVLPAPGPNVGPLLPYFPENGPSLGPKPEGGDDPGTHDWRFPPVQGDKWLLPPHPDDLAPQEGGGRDCRYVTKYCRAVCSKLVFDLDYDFTPWKGKGSRNDSVFHCQDKCKGHFGCPTAASLPICLPE